MLPFAEAPERKQTTGAEGTTVRRNGILRSCYGHFFGGTFALAIACSAGGIAQAQQAPPPPVKIGIVTFLSGPAASPFGVPGRNGAEIVIEALNAGTAPAPYNTVGLGGAKIEAKYVDEAGSTAQVVTEFRNLVQRDQVEAVLGPIPPIRAQAKVPALTTALSASIE